MNIPVRESVRDLITAVAASLAILVTLAAGLILTRPAVGTTYLLPAIPAVSVAAYTDELTVIDSAGLGINPAAIAAPAAGPVGAMRTAAATAR